MNNNINKYIQKVNSDCCDIFKIKMQSDGKHKFLHVYIYIHNVHSKGTTESQRLVSAQQTVTILSRVVTCPLLTLAKSIG